MQPHANLHSDDIHFNKEGSTRLASQVAGVIAKHLTR
jgi:lysophospholipase L1-like esterase